MFGWNPAHKPEVRRELESASPPDSMADILTMIGVADARSLGNLLPALQVVQRMTDTYEQIKFGQRRCKVVIKRAASIIKEVYTNLRNDQVSGPGITKLQQELEEVHSILQRLAGMSFFKALLHFGDVDREIRQANNHIDMCSQLFSINYSSHVQAQNKAAISDRDALRDLLRILAGNYEEIRRRFGLYTDKQEDEAMAVMERELGNARITSEDDTPVEVQIMQKSLECIKATTGRSAPKQSEWLITEYDIDYCGTIGGGGFSTVRKARFRGMIVAVKVLKDIGNTGEALEKEIQIWSRLRHDHIVPFYGASTLTSPPYIVSRYMQNGNLVQYLIATPHANRMKLIYEVSLGMYYLHEECVIHGDLKSVNVLVDDAGKACITDFGLSKVCSLGTTRTGTSKIAGTLRFLAPEALKGSPLSFETDMYAFGMLIYEVFTEDVPFIMEPDHLVREGLVELQRPTSSKVYERGFNDTLWKLLSDCISREPSARPPFKEIQASLLLLKKAEPLAQSAHLDPIPSGTERNNRTKWIFDTELIPAASTSPASNNSMAPLLRTSGSVSGVQSSTSSRRSITHNMKTLPSMLPTCIEVTHTYFNAKFGVSGREPGVYLEEPNTFQWQPIRAKKKSLLSEDGNRFWYKSNIDGGKNSWELSGTEVTLRTSRWFRLQLSYARDGSVGDWGTTMGDWLYTERGWRRIVRGKFQRARLDDPNEVPTDNAWTDVDLPKRCIIDNYAGTDNCLVYITNPGKQPGRLCCKLDGRKIIFETYQQQSDKEPMMTREETYPSEDRAGTMFDVLQMVLEKTAEKKNKTFILSF